MINRDNWCLAHDYLKYRQEVDRVSLDTLKLEYTWLINLLEWAGGTSFQEVEKIRPTFPEYVETKKKHNGEAMSREYMRKLVSVARLFLGWLTMHKKGYRTTISPGWLDTLKLHRLPQTKGMYEHEHVTLDEIKAMAAAPVYSMRDQRIKAAAAFWFLSGIRINAFVSLPINAVDLSNMSVKQWPKLGVRTKNGKHATTYLLNIPEVLTVVRKWDTLVREHLPETSFWFAPLSPDTGTFDATIQEVGAYRDARARTDLKEWLDKVGLPYHSPHKFRHGNAVYSLDNSNDVADLKAVSQNLMHSNLSTTDGVYGALSGQSVGDKIKRLGGKAAKGNVTKDELIDNLEQILERLKTN